MISIKKFAVAYLTCFLIPLVETAMHEVRMFLPPTDNSVKYNDGYIRAPGVIDLSRLTFTTILNADNPDNIFEEEIYSLNRKWEDIIFSDGHNKETNNQRQIPDGDVDDEDEELPIDVVVIPLPSGCSKHDDGCDWSEFGIGRRAADGDIMWCCSEVAVRLGLCTGDESSYGRILIDAEKFEGENSVLMMPKVGFSSEFMENGAFNVEKSGLYAVVYANCREDGQDIAITGESVWKSRHGYLPGELYPFMVFFTAVTILYFFLFIWFGRLMVAFVHQGIQVERWILIAITLGLLEMIMRSEDYFVWNQSGYRSPYIILTGILVGVLKKGISRCVLVMLSMGWGVSRDTLGKSMKKIVILGSCYILVSSVADSLVVFAVESMAVLSFKAESEITFLVSILNGFLKILDIVFICWILSSFNHTQNHLAKLKQIRKMERINNLQLLIQVAVAIAIATQIIVLLDHFSVGNMVSEEYAWAKAAAGEVNYLIVLIGIAYLWRPNEHSREYLYVMELSTKEEDALVQYACDKSENRRE